MLGEIYAQALAAAGYTVKTELNLGDEKTALKALEDGQINAYPEYTGTALLSFFGVPADKLPNDPAEAYEQVKADFAKDGHHRVPADAVHVLERGGGDARRPPTSSASRTISDLKGKSQDLTLYGSPECRQRLDCLLGPARRSTA